MRSMTKPVAVTVVSLAVIGCGEILERPTAASPEDVAAVAQLVADIDRIHPEEDLDAFIAYAADDCVVLAPDGPAVVGKDAIRELYRGMYEAIDLSLTHHPIETHAYGDLLVHRGTATGTMTPAGGGEPIPFDNKYLFVLLKEDDGSLKFWRVVFNSNVPPAM